MSNGSKILGVGTILGILFAPDKGEETRRKIRKKGEDILDDIKRKINEANDELDNLSKEMEDGNPSANRY
mgnify:CR=1 FL=1